MRREMLHRMPKWADHLRRLNWTWSPTISCVAFFIGKCPCAPDPNVPERGQLLVDMRHDPYRIFCEDCGRLFSRGEMPHVDANVDADIRCTPHLCTGPGCQCSRNLTSQ